MSNIVPRFFGGWNKFIRDNEVEIHDTVFFSMVEELDGIVFNVGFSSRN